jgi:polar amino acid transport system substrate-binding protein
MALSFFTVCAHAENLLDTVKERGVVRIGVGYTVPPMNYINDNGEHVGFDVDLAKEVAKHLGLKMELIKVNNKTRVSFLATGRTDMTVSSMNHTLGRDQVIDFSVPYLRDGKRVLAKAGLYKELKDFVGKKVAVVQGSNAGIAIKDKLAELGDPNPQILSFQNNAECFIALKSGKVDGYTNDTVIMLGVSGGDKAFEPVGDFYSPTYFSIGVPEKQSDWLDAINFALRDMQLDGSYEKVYNKWFGPDAQYSGFPKSNIPIDIWPK